MESSADVFAYWHAVTDKASQTLSRNALDYLLAEEQGQELPCLDPLISAETSPELSRLGMEAFAQEHTRAFLELLKVLDPEYQEMCLEYYLCECKQTTLAQVHGRTQTVCSSELRASVRSMVAASILGKRPTRETIQDILTGAHMEDVQLQVNAQGKVERKPVSLSHVIYLLIQTRSFKDVSRVFQVHRPVIRKCLRQVAAKLAASEDIREVGLACLVHRLIYRSSPDQEGMSNRQRAKTKKLAHLRVNDSAVLGAFEVDVRDPDFDGLFTTTADPTP